MKRHRLHDEAANHVTRIEARVNTSYAISRNPAFRPERCPVVSCDLTECELPEIGFGVAEGQLAVKKVPFTFVATVRSNAPPRSLRLTA
jgi:hypothetical protein